MRAEQVIREIVLPETSPATEWIGDRPVAKMSPTRRHGSLQLEIGACLRRWARGKGDVASEWRFRVTPAGSYTRPLVPDVAYLSYERSRVLSDEELETPPIAPDLVVEILSPDDRPGDVTLKCAQYLSAGTTLVVHVDLLTRRVDAYDAADQRSSQIAPVAFASRHFPELSIPFAAIFEEVDRSLIAPGFRRLGRNAASPSLVRAAFAAYGSTPNVPLHTAPRHAIVSDGIVRDPTRRAQRSRACCCRATVLCLHFPRQDRAMPRRRTS